MATVLMDFDGIFTHLRKQADAFQNATIELFTERSGRPIETVRQDFYATQEAVLRESTKYGWIVDGHLGAYADEDLFILVTAVALELIENFEKEYGRVTYESLQKVFQESTKRTRPDFKEDWLEVAQELNEKHNMYIATTSSEEKVKGWLKEHDQRLRVIGGIKKFKIDNSYDKVLEAVEVEGRKVLLRRPDYDRVLLETEADVVVGDVYSLDLALPQARNIRSILVKNDYTPSWVVTHMSKTGIVIEKLSELPYLIK